MEKDLLVYKKAIMDTARGVFHLKSKPVDASYLLGLERGIDLMIEVFENCSHPPKEDGYDKGVILEVCSKVEKYNKDFDVHFPVHFPADRGVVSPAKEQELEEGAKELGLDNPDTEKNLREQKKLLQLKMAVEWWEQVTPAAKKQMCFEAFDSSDFVETLSEKAVVFLCEKYYHLTYMPQTGSFVSLVVLPEDTYHSQVM